jgi:CRP-like cAMP-binding protein
MATPELKKGPIMKYRSRRATFTEQRLATLALFERCTNKELSTLATWATELAIDAGRNVCRENLTGPQFVVVLQGRLELSRAGQRVATVNAGEWFGHDALLDHRLAEAVTAIAGEPTRLLVLSAREFTSLLNLVPSLQGALATPASRSLVDHIAGQTASSCATAVRVARTDEELSATSERATSLSSP